MLVKFRDGLWFNTDDIVRVVTFHAPPPKDAPAVPHGLSYFLIEVEFRGGTVPHRICVGPWTDADAANFVEGVLSGQVPPRVGTDAVWVKDPAALAARILGMIDTADGIAYDGGWLEKIEALIRGAAHAG